MGDHGRQMGFDFSQRQAVGFLTLRHKASRSRDMTISSLLKAVDNDDDDDHQQHCKRLAGLAIVSIVDFAITSLRRSSPT